MSNIPWVTLYKFYTFFYIRYLWYCIYLYEIFFVLYIFCGYYGLPSGYTKILNSNSIFITISYNKYYTNKYKLLEINRVYITRLVYKFFCYINDMEGNLKLELCMLVIIIIIARILFLIHKITTGHSRYNLTKREKACKTFICIGSGGHTTEMLKLTEHLDFDKYSPRYYVIASNDLTSTSKVEELEMIKGTTNYEIYKIPRSRMVHQSFFSSIFTTLFSIIYSIPLVIKVRPDLILCNGPGTCIPICLICFLLKAAFIVDTKIVFIESFCRTRTFSLTGKILTYIADNFLVQWPGLKKKLKRSEYIGQLM